MGAKRVIPFLLLLAMLSAISGFMMSHMSFIGRIGINLMHKEYKFLKIWWQGGAVVYAALLTFFIIQSIIQRSLPFAAAKVVHVLLFLAAIGGLYYTFSDFSGDFTHHLLKSVFHMGAYLFWVGWMLISIFFISIKRIMVTGSGTTVSSVEQIP